MHIIEDGLGTTLTWTNNSSFALYKVRIKPFGIEGGDPIDLTHLGNTAWRTKAARTLKEATAIEFTAQWDPSDHVDAPINTLDTITITYPDGDSHEVQGYLRSLEPGDVVEGAMVECEGVIEVSCRDSGGTETAPTYSSGGITT